MDTSWRVGVVSFTDPRETTLARERERYLRERHQALVSFVRGQGFVAVDPLGEMRREGDAVFGLRAPDELTEALRRLRNGRADCLIIGCWHSTDPRLPLRLVTDLNAPALLYAEDDPSWAGAAALSAIGGALWESGAGENALSHRRILGDMSKIPSWVRGVCALANLRRSSLLMWAGAEGLANGAPDDEMRRVKRVLITDIRAETASALARRLEQIAADEPQRIARFIAWLRAGGAQIGYEGATLTPGILEKQVALYLAARDRLRELASEPIAGVSVGCQLGLAQQYGVTACLLPAFLPFACDSEGAQSIVPTVCDGDIKGLLTCALMWLIRPDTPPLYGSLKYLGEESLVLANCGGASVYYAHYSNDPAQTLPRLRLAAQCLGIPGAAIGGYDGHPSPVTVSRLCRIGDRYVMQLGRGTSLQLDERLKSRIGFGAMWPHTAIFVEMPRELLVRVVGSGHYCAIAGDVSAEMEAACAAAAIPVLHIDSPQEMATFDAAGRSGRLG